MNITVDDKQMEISDSDFKWIAERIETSPSGSVTFSQSAMSRFRKITEQKEIPTYKIRIQMLYIFGHLA